MSNKYVLLFAIVLGVIVVDQWSKQVAVRYLRSPSDRDYRTEHFAPCTKEHTRCEKLCRARAQSAQSSLVACQRQCKRQETLCRDELSPSYERAKKAWKETLSSLQSSFWCRRIEYPSAARPECVVIERYFHFTYRTNSGAAWGIFSTLEDNVRRPFFICITLVAILFIFYLFSFRLESEHRLMIIALALILGGALGNFLDRLRLDYVIDFIEWFWRSRASYTWPTFNIADAAISIGVGLIAIELFFFPEEELEDEQDEDGQATSDNPSGGGTAGEVEASTAGEQGEPSTGSVVLGARDEVATNAASSGEASVEPMADGDVQVGAELRDQTAQPGEQVSGSPDTGDGTSANAPSDVAMQAEIKGDTPNVPVQEAQDTPAQQESPGKSEHDDKNT